MQSVLITTDVVSSNLDQGEVYNIMWMSVTGRWFFPGPLVSSYRNDTTEILLKVALNTIKETSYIMVASLRRRYCYIEYTSLSANIVERDFFSSTRRHERDSNSQL